MASTINGGHGGFDYVPSKEIYIPVYRISHFLDDLESLALSWSSLAVTYRMTPSGPWARLVNNDHTRDALVLEGSARQLDAAIKRFREGA